MTLLDFNHWLIQFNTYTGLPGIMYFLLFVREWKTISAWIFFVLLASFLADLSNYFFVRFVYPNGFLISNTWFLVNYFLMSLLFHHLLVNRRKLVWALFGGFVVGSIVSFVNFYTYYESNTFIRVYSNVAFVVLSLMAFYQMLEAPRGKLSTSPVFWLLTAFFVYGSMTLLKNLFQQYLIFELEISASSFSIISLINLFANIFKNFALFYAIVLIDKGYPDKIPNQHTDD